MGDTSVMNLEGREAPDFALEGTDGKTHRLSDYWGNTVVLYFYPRNNTPGCTKEACAFRDRFPTFQGLNVVVLGVSRDSIGSHDQFIADFHLPFILLSDPEAKTMREYGAFGQKTVSGKTTEGTIRSTVVISPDGRILRHRPQIAKAEEHPQEVLDYLMELKT